MPRPGRVRPSFIRVGAGLRRWKVAESKKEWRRELASKFIVAAAVKVLWGLIVELVIRPHE